MKATGSASSNEEIAVAYNRFPGLSTEMRYTILAAALEARKYEEDTKRREREDMERQQARALLELEDFLCNSPRNAASPTQGAVPDSDNADLIDLRSNTL